MREQLYARATAHCIRRDRKRGCVCSNITELYADASTQAQALCSQTWAAARAPTRFVPDILLAFSDRPLKFNSHMKPKSVLAVPFARSCHLPSCRLQLQQRQQKGESKPRATKLSSTDRRVRGGSPCLQAPIAPARRRQSCSPGHKGKR